MAGDRRQRLRRRPRRIGLARPRGADRGRARRARHLHAGRPGLAHLAGVDASATAALGARTAQALLEVLDSTQHEIVAGAEDFTTGGEPSAAATRSSTSAGPSPTYRSRSCAAARSRTWRRRSPRPERRRTGDPRVDRRKPARCARVQPGHGCRGRGIRPRVRNADDADSRPERTSASACRSRRSGPTSRTLSYPGGWLAERLLDLPAFVTLHGVITLGDSALAAVVGLDPSFVPGRRYVVTDLDMRLMWGDLLARPGRPG